MVDAGHSDITVLDLSEAALDLARGRLGGQADMVTWLAADLLTWQPTRQYAIWHDRAVLHFLTDPTDRSRYVDSLRSALMSGGHAIIATFAPGPVHCSGLPVQRSSAQEIADLLGHDFQLLRARSASTGRRQVPPSRSPGSSLNGRANLRIAPLPLAGSRTSLGR